MDKENDTLIRKIVCGDNLAILELLNSESIDLVYIDPPFFSGRQYAVVYGDAEELRQFDDRWVKDEGSNRANKDINVYLEWMEPRIRELHRVLKPTGSFYLHCDWHADAYLRVLCDKIFGYDNLLNVITWKRAYGKSATRKYPVESDTILFYKKGDDYYFEPPTAGTIKKSQNEYQVDEQGRVFRWSDMTAPGASRRFEWRVTIPSKGRSWRWSAEEMDQLVDDGLIRLKKDGTAYVGRGFKRVTGKSLPHLQVSTIWDDINPIGGGAKERMGYPTQKPIALLERVINASSKPGDIVLDCFCGCGTTIAAAEKLGRSYAGIDVSPTACRAMLKRLQGSGVDIHVSDVEGLPVTVEEVSEMSGWEFQNWVVREFAGEDGIQGKRGADGGIDGEAFGVPIQVKKYKAGRPDVDSFSGALLREGKKEAVYIALDYTSTFKKEIARLRRENNITIHTFSLADILAKKHVPLVNKYRVVRVTKRGV